MHIDPQFIISTINDRLLERDQQLLFFWLKISSDRNEYSKQFRFAQNEFFCISLILRDDTFNNVNSFQNDIVKLLNNNKEFILDSTSSYDFSKPLVVIILSKSELHMPQISSPALLPAWFPICPNQWLEILLEDLTNIAEAPLNMPEAKIGEMCQLLYDTEGMVINRLQTVHRTNHNSGNAFFELVRLPEEKYQEFLDGALTAHQSISNPAGYRPSAKDTKSLISRIMRNVSKTSPDQLSKTAKAFSTALNVTDDFIASPPMSILTVMMRSTQPETSTSLIFSKNLILSMFAVSQFVTASSHSDSYPHMPVTLLRSISYDLRHNLYISIETLRLLN